MTFDGSLPPVQAVSARRLDDAPKAHQVPLNAKISHPERSLLGGTCKAAEISAQNLGPSDLRVAEDEAAPRAVGRHRRRRGGDRTRRWPGPDPGSV